jgi:hypothetical protein
MGMPAPFASISVQIGGKGGAQRAQGCIDCHDEQQTGWCFGEILIDPKLVEFLNLALRAGRLFALGIATAELSGAIAEIAAATTPV